jgi:hypothetical protein
VHLLHVTLTLSTGHHPSRAIVQLCLLWLSSEFQAEEEPLGQLPFLRCSWLQICLFAIHEFALVMKHIVAPYVWVCAFLKSGNCVKW